MNELDGRVVIVTGAASGIGRATAAALADAGAAVAAVDRNQTELDAAVESMRADGKVAHAFPLDLADPVTTAAVVDDVLTTVGAPYGLVNVAGITGRWSIAETSVDDWNEMLAVNLTAPFVLIKHVGAAMVDAGRGGRIVNVTSSAAFTGLSPVAYSCTKAALVQLTRVAAAELGRHDINVNAVAPGLTRTPMTAGRGSGEEFDRHAVEGPLANLLGRPSEPEDIANVIVFLCSSASRQITGQTVHVSAGNIFS